MNTSLTHDQRRDIKTLLIIIAVLIAITFTSCQNGQTTALNKIAANTTKLSTDSVTYDMYRGYRVMGGDITPVYIPVKDSVFHATDTIRVNSFGTYDPNGTFRVVIGVYMGHVKFAKEE